MSSSPPTRTRAPRFRIVLGESGLVQPPYLYLGQKIDEAQVPQTSERLPAHVELHRLDRGRAQDAPVPLFKSLTKYLFVREKKNSWRARKFVIKHGSSLMAWWMVLTVLPIAAPQNGCVVCAQLSYQSHYVQSSTSDRIGGDVAIFPRQVVTGEERKLKIMWRVSSCFFFSAIQWYHLGNEHSPFQQV